MEKNFRLAEDSNIVINALVAEKKELLEQLEAARAEVAELRSRVVTLQQTSDQSYSSEDYQRLAEKIHELEVERGELRRQLAELQQAEGESSGILPEPDDLLNQVKGKLPKSKVTRRDVVEILGILS